MLNGTDAALPGAGSSSTVSKGQEIEQASVLIEIDKFFVDVIKERSQSCPGDDKILTGG